MRIQKERDDGNMRMLAIRCLRSQYKNIRVRSDVLRPLTVILVCMFLAWSFVPQGDDSPEVIAVLGYALSAAVCSLKGIKVRQSIDFKSVLTIAAFFILCGGGESNGNSHSHGGISSGKYSGYEKF